MTTIQERPNSYGGFRTRELAVSGETPTLLLFHGFGDCADTWRLVLQRCHELGQSALAVDLPGFGRADRLRPGALMPQLDAFVSDVVARHGTDGPVVVVGNSLGAAVAVRAARTANPAVGAVLALGAAGHGWNRLTGSVPYVSRVLRRMPVLQVPWWLHQATTRWALGWLLYGERGTVDARVVASFGASVADFAAARRLLLLGAQIIAELDASVEHGGVGVPMTVLHGTADRLVPVSAGRTLHHANPGSRLVLLNRIGHCPQLDAPDAVVAHARALIDEIKKRHKGIS